MDDDRSSAIALAAIVALVIDDEQGAEAAQVWAECLIEAAEAEGVPIPQLGLYTVDGAEYYGFQVGPWASRVDSGLGVHDGHELIRVLYRLSDLHLWPAVAAIFRMFGLHRGDDYYFGLRGAEFIGISLTGRYAVEEYFGKTGREAVVRAIQDALVYYK